MTDACDECGSHDVRRDHVYGVLVEECRLCGHLQGDPASVARVAQIREAEALGVAPELVALIETLGALPGVAVDRSLSTAAGHAEPPAIYFCVAQQPLVLLDRLARSLLLAARRTSTLWTIEVVHQAGRLWFVLRPRLPGPVAAMTADLALLRAALDRDERLGWGGSAAGR